MNELQFVNYLRKVVKHGKDVVHGIGDDAAVLKYTSDKYLLFACDMLVEGVHFAKKADPEAIGWKAIAVNISDIAAMGGIPKYVVVSVGIPTISQTRFGMVKGILKGAKAVCKKYGIEIVGGDTNRAKHTVIDAAIIGEVEKKSLVLRSGAKVGDLIFVTGTLGEGRLKHMKFTPRLREAKTLVKNFKINSMVDISDGLFLDLTRVAQASNVGAFIYKSLIPLNPNKPRGFDWVKSLEYGEDFELLFTLSINEAKRLMRYMGKYEYPPVTLIGEVVSRGKGLNFVGDEGKVTKIKPKGYLHFR